MSPLLRGRTLTTARAALADLSARFLALRPADLPDASLADGLAGVALAHAALHPLFPAAGHAARAERALHRAIDRIAATPVSPGLHLGVAGVGWAALQLVEPAGHGALEASLFRPIDRLLAGTLAQPGWRERFDVIHGLAGVGVYALERRTSASGRALLAAVLDGLAAAASPQAHGVAWRSSPAWITCDERVERPADQDLGLGAAHGAAGVIALLGRVAAADVDRATRRRARTLLDGAVGWLLAQADERGAPSAFPYFATTAPAARPATRLAWCSGDLGIAAALLVAGEAAGRPAWRRAALDLARRAAARPLADAGAVDAGLCHGAAGVAHVFHRAFLASGDATLAGAARRWFAHALAMRAPGQGFAGFRALDPDRRHRLRWRPAAGFLTGASGVTLALVAATTGAAPTWDRALLVS